MSQVTVTTTSSPVAVLSLALTKTMTVMMDPTSLGLAAFTGHVVVMLPSMI